MAITLEKIEKWEEENNIKKLVKALRSGFIDEKNREAAVKALVRIGKPAVKPLIKALGGLTSAEEDVILAAKVLVDIGDDEALAPIIKALKDWKGLKNKKRSIKKQAAEVLDSISWKPVENAEKVNYLIAREEWKELEKIGEPALEALQLCLKDEEVEIRRNAASVLGKIGDIKAIDPLLFSLTLSPGLDEETWRSYKDLVPVVTEALASIGKPDIEPLIKSLEEAKHSLLDGIPLLWALGMIGEKKAMGAVVDWIFNVCWMVPAYVGEPILFKVNSETEQSSSISSPDFIKELIPQKILPRLLGDYTDLILGIFDWKNTADQNKWDISKCKEAIQKLCATNTPLSNNILHKILTIKSLTVGYQFDNIEESVEYIDFESFRNAANDELQNRGNPPYDPSIYSNEESWKL